MSTATEEKIIHRAYGRGVYDIADLRAALPLLKISVARRYVVGGMECVRFYADTLATFDFETSVLVKVGMEGDGVVGLVPFDALASAVKALPRKGFAEIYASDDGRTLHVGNIRVSVYAGYAADIPLRPRAMDASDTLVARNVPDLRGVSVAAGPVLTQVWLTPSASGYVEAQATDRYRLSILPFATEGAGGTFIPAKIVTALKGATMDIYRGTVERVGDMVTLHAGDVTVTYRPHEGTFPRVGSLIPTDADTVELSRSALLEACAMAKASKPGTDGAYVVLNGKTAQAQYGGDILAEMALPIAAYPLDAPIAFNHVFLSSLLKDLGTDAVTVGMTVPNRPIVIRTADSDATRLLMPIRLKQ